MMRSVTRLVYVADTQIPSRATNGIQVMRMCEAFAAAGADVTLVHPYRFGNRPEGLERDVWAFYGVEPTFRRITLPTPLTLRLASNRRLARALRLPALAAYVLQRSIPGRKPFLAYGRSMLGLRLATMARRAPHSACRGVVAELHDIPREKAAWDTLSVVDGVVTISAELELDLLQARPSLAGRTHVEHDGFEERLIESVGHLPTDVRRTLGMPVDQPLVVYTGRVTTGKGARVVIQAAGLLPDVHFALVGKVYEDDLVELGRRAGNVTFTGFVPPAAVGRYLAAADVLAMPTHPSLPYAAYTSPLKLFEYMAASRPIVSADLPALREVVSHGRNALLFTAGDVHAFTSAVRTVLSDRSLAERIGRQARIDVQRFSWNARAKRILKWLSTELTPTRGLM
jgi:glycosyltransferase involved in cell wall biosynthesis